MNTLDVLQFYPSSAGRLIKELDMDEERLALSLDVGVGARVASDQAGPPRVTFKLGPHKVSRDKLHLV